MLSVREIRRTHTIDAVTFISQVNILHSPESRILIDNRSLFRRGDQMSIR